MPFKKIIVVIIQLLFLLLLNELGYLIVNTFHLPVPGNVLGMVLLFILLLTGVIKLSWIEDGSSLLIKHLAFFFIPIAVGLMNFGELFIKNGVSFLVVIIGSIIVGMYITGAISQGLMKKKGGVTNDSARHVV